MTDQIPEREREFLERQFREAQTNQRPTVLPSGRGNKRHAVPPVVWVLCGWAASGALYRATFEAGAWWLYQFATVSLVLVVAVTLGHRILFGASGRSDRTEPER